jgi:hypothetical protein
MMIRSQIEQALLDKTITDEEKSILKILQMSTIPVEDKEFGIPWEIQAIGRGVDRKLYLILHPLSSCRNWQLHEQILVCPVSEYFAKFQSP